VLSWLQICTFTNKWGKRYYVLLATA
jgi:hypothetical protein